MTDEDRESFLEKLFKEAARRANEADFPDEPPLTRWPSDEDLAARGLGPTEPDAGESGASVKRKRRERSKVIPFPIRYPPIEEKFHHSPNETAPYGTQIEDDNE